MKKTSKRNAEAGFSLVEILISIFLLSGLIATLGYQYYQEAKNRVGLQQQMQGRQALDETLTVIRSRPDAFPHILSDHGLPLTYVGCFDEKGSPKTNLVTQKAGFVGMELSMDAAVQMAPVTQPQTACPQNEGGTEVHVAYNPANSREIWVRSILLGSRSGEQNAPTRIFERGLRLGWGLSASGFEEIPVPGAVPSADGTSTTTVTTTSTAGTSSTLPSTTTTTFGGFVGVITLPSTTTTMTTTTTTTSTTMGVGSTTSTTASTTISTTTSTTTSTTLGGGPPTNADCFSRHRTQCEDSADPACETFISYGGLTPPAPCVPGPSGGCTIQCPAPIDFGDGCFCQRSHSKGPTTCGCLI